jgi:serine/threonine-protein kinase
MSDHEQGTQTWIDAIATPFDRVWWTFVRRGCTGQRPRIEDFLIGVAEPRRSQLLAELLRVEVKFRQQAGERPTAADYEQQFREHCALIRDLFAGETELVDHVPSGAVSAEVETPRQVVGRYELLEEIGRGGEGIVYRARELDFPHKEVAIKVLLAGAVGTGEAAARFLREIRRMAGFEHLHIVPYLASGNDRGQLYYVMRYMSGGSLDRFLKGRSEPLNPADAAGLLIQIAEAVAYLHTQEKSVVHRDLKPLNILLDKAGQLFVADFGLAEVLDGNGGGPEGGACGTPPYWAPEQFDSRLGEVGPLSDVYSLGVILYEMIAGRLPFPRVPRSESIFHTINSEPVPLSRFRAGVPERLERICVKCLRKKTRDRYASSDELVAALNRFVRNEPDPTTPAHTPWQRIRDWARSEPALAARLAVIVACSVILWGYRLITGEFAQLEKDHWIWNLEVANRVREAGLVEPAIVCLNQVILVAWGLASWAFQRQLTRKGHGGGLQFGWRVIDVLALSLLIQMDDALMSPLPVAFAVLIVASAFWARADHVLQTTLLSMYGYLALVLAYGLGHSDFPHAYWHFHYLVGLALLGLMLIHQANRTRALARISGARDR